MEHSEETVVVDADGSAIDSDGFTGSAEGTVEYDVDENEVALGAHEEEHALARLEEEAAKHRQALQAKEVEIKNLRLVRATMLRDEADELERRAAEMRDQADEYDPPDVAQEPLLVDDDTPINFVPVDSGTMVDAPKPRKRKATKKVKRMVEPEAPKRRAKKSAATGPKPEAKAVLRQLKQNPEVSAADLARSAGWDKNATLAVLKTLEAGGQVAREGIKNGTKWSVA